MEKEKKTITISLSGLICFCIILILIIAIVLLVKQNNSYSEKISQMENDIIAINSKNIKNNIAEENNIIENNTVEVNNVTENSVVSNTTTQSKEESKKVTSTKNETAKTSTQQETDQSKDKKVNSYVGSWKVRRMMENGEETNLFGSSIIGVGTGELTLSENGKFTEDIAPVSCDEYSYDGTYTVSGSTIKLLYSDGRTTNIIINSDDTLTMKYFGDESNAEIELIKK